MVGVNTNGNDSLATGMVQMQNTGIITSCGSIQQRHGRYDISCIEERGVHFEILMKQIICHSSVCHAFLTGLLVIQWN